MSDNRAVAADQAIFVYSQGLGRLTWAILQAVNEAGIVAGRANVTYSPNWQSGRAIPNVIQIEIAPEGGKAVRTQFTRLEIENCSKEVHDSYVLGTIQNIAREYVKLRQTS